MSFALEWSHRVHQERQDPECVFCSKKGQAIDYKDTALLRTYIAIAVKNAHTLLNSCTFNHVKCIKTVSRPSTNRSSASTTSTIDSIHNSAEAKIRNVLDNGLVTIVPRETR